MAKKALKRASWRTIARRAIAAEQPLAGRLRKRAADLRRAERAVKRKKVKKAAPNERRTVKSLAREAHKAGLAVQISTIPRSARVTKGWATRRANQVRAANAASANQAMIAATAGPDLSQAQHRANVVGQNGALVATDRGPPGKGELVGGAFSQMADRIAKLARKKGGTDAIQNELAALAQSSKYEGCVETDKAATKRLIAVQEAIAQRVVCGFIAEVNQAINEHRGLPSSMTWVLNSFLITKIVDALHNAGYSASGMTNTDTADMAKERTMSVDR